MTHAGLDVFWKRGHKGNHLGSCQDLPLAHGIPLREERSLLPPVLSPPVSPLGSTRATVDPGRDVGASTHEVLHI